MPDYPDSYDKRELIQFKHTDPIWCRYLIDRTRVYLYRKEGRWFVVSVARDYGGGDPAGKLNAPYIVTVQKCQD